MERAVSSRCTPSSVSVSMCPLSTGPLITTRSMTAAAGAPRSWLMATPCTTTSVLLMNSTWPTRA